MTQDSLMMAATVEVGEQFRIRGREDLFQLPRAVFFSQIRVCYDVSLDDQRFILMREMETDEDATPPVILVENWLWEVRERVGRQSH